MRATSSGTAGVTLPADDKILITREFDAPRRLVWEAWTTPELVKRWWHARRGEVTVVEIDLRVGGRWRSVMIANDGTKVAFHGEYHEIVPTDRIVSTEVFEGLPEGMDPEEHASLNTVTFTEANGRTTLAMLLQYVSKADRDAVIASGMEAGLQDALDLLEEVSASLR